MSEGCRVMISSYGSVEAGVTQATQSFHSAAVVNSLAGTACTKIKACLFWHPNCTKQLGEAELNTTPHPWNCQGVWRIQSPSPLLLHLHGFIFAVWITFRLRVLLVSPACSLFHGQLSLCWDPQHLKGVRLWQD